MDYRVRPRKHKGPTLRTVAKSISLRVLGNELFWADFGRQWFANLNALLRIRRAPELFPLSVLIAGLIQHFIFTFFGNQLLKRFHDFVSPDHQGFDFVFIEETFGVLRQFVAV